MAATSDSTTRSCWADLQMADCMAEQPGWCQCNAIENGYSTRAMGSAWTVP